MTRAAALALLLLSSGLAFAQDMRPERTVAGNVITSARDPAAKIGLPKEAKYIGSDRWALYGIADAEIHVFLEADAKNVIQRLYWVQFEGYLPSKPDSVYNYKDSIQSVGGRDYHVA